MTDHHSASAPGQVVLLAGPSGSGKSHVSRGSGLPVLCLDEFYKDGDDPSCPRDEALGIVDWDDPAAWDADAAVEAIRSICVTGSADIPRYDIASDRSVGTTRFCRDDHPVFVAEGVFAGQVVQRCAQQGLLADAIVITRSPWKNFARRLARDLTERRKPPPTLMRRGRALMRQESALVARLVDAGCRPLDGAAAVAALAGWARTTALDPTD